MARTSRQIRGASGEDQALAFLEQHRFVLVERNAASRLGEIDLIMRDGAVLVFVEVRVRRSMAFGGAAASVTVGKQIRLRRQAQAWLKQHFGDADWPECRFDVLAFEAGEPHWIRAAF